MNSSLNTESNNSPLSRLLRKEKTIVSRTENKMEIIRFLDDLEGFLGALENKGLTYSKSTDGTYVLRYMNDHRQMIPESLLRERYSEEQKTFKIYLEEYYDLAKKHSLNISEHHGLNFLAYTPIEILAENTEYLKTIDVDAQLISNLLNDELAVSLEQRIAFYRKKFYLKDVFGFDNWEKCMKQFLEKNKSITFQTEEYFELWGLLAEDGIIKNLNEFLLEKFMVLNFTDKEEFLDYFRNHKKSVPKNIKEYIFKEKDVKLIGSHINMFEPIDPVFFESIKETIFTGEHSDDSDWMAQAVQSNNKKSFVIYLTNDEFLHYFPKMESKIKELVQIFFTRISKEERQKVLDYYFEHSEGINLTYCKDIAKEYGLNIRNDQVKKIKSWDILKNPHMFPNIDMKEILLRSWNDYHPDIVLDENRKQLFSQLIDVFQNQPYAVGYFRQYISFLVTEQRPAEDFQYILTVLHDEKCIKVYREYFETVENFPSWRGMKGNLKWKPYSIEELKTEIMDAKEAEKQREVYDFVDDVNDILSMRKRHIARYLSQHEFFRELPRNLKIGYSTYDVQKKLYKIFMECYTEISKDEINSYLSDLKENDLVDVFIGEQIRLSQNKTLSIRERIQFAKLFKYIGEQKGENILYNQLEDQIKEYIITLPFEEAWEYVDGIQLKNIKLLNKFDINAKIEFLNHLPWLSNLPKN